MTLAVMLQGTASDVGKSVLVAGLCRIFHQDGLRTAPFKSQNMALNSGITPDGKEMGRAQIFQAEAAGIAPDVRMNPILLKPTSDRQAQVVLMGQVATSMDAMSYHQYKPRLREQILAVYQSLAGEYEALVLEGAGSPAEINLRDRDIVNMGMAEMAQCPVILVADIDRGGVFAAIYGTLALLQPEERARVKGVIINKFRGDVALLRSGIEQIEALTGVPVLGVMPWLDVDLEDEDGVALQAGKYHRTDRRDIDIAVVHLPHIANFTDFNALAAQPDVRVRYVRDPQALADADLVIESMAEDTQAKIDFYKKLAPVLPQKTVIVTNSSTLLPSTFAKYTGRPEKYLSLHFANSIWKNNMTEVMAQDQTDKRYFDELVDFANDIRMLTLPVNKEKNGYLLNSMLVPWLLSGLDLYVSGVSDPKSIDLAWTRGTGAPKGPFRVFDTVGIQTAYNIVMQYQKVPGLVSPLLKKMMMPYNFKAMASVLKKMLDEGKLGESSGEGFFTY